MASALPKSGGAPAPVAAIPVKVGAGASTAALFDRDEGFVPAFTTSGLAAGFASAIVLLAEDPPELVGFAELGSESSSEAASPLSVFLFLSESICESGVEAEGVVAIAGAGFTLPLGFAIGAAAAGAGATAVGAGELAGPSEWPPNFVQPK